MKNSLLKKVLSIILVILVAVSVLILPGTTPKASAACASGCSFTAQKVGIKYLKSEATCGKAAVYYYSCAVCGASSAETNDAKTFNYGTAPDHNWGPAVTVPATCTEPEMKVQTCSRCGQKYAKKGLGTGTGHAYKKTTLPVTCVSDGYDLFECTICGYSYKDNWVTDRQHSYIENKKEATCTSAGLITYACSVCGATKDSFVIPALGHDKKISNAIPPTCVYEGYNVYKCARCGIEDRETVAPLGHFYPSEWTVIITPDCQTKGAKIKVCTNCNNIISETIPRTGHIDLNGDSKCDTCDKTITIVEPDEPETPVEKPCDCDCHAGGIKAFFFKLINFFAKIFDKNARVCDCGKAH